MAIYHLISPADWEITLNRKEYAPPSLMEEGFIHCSTKEQLIETASRHYGDHQELIVLKIRQKKVAAMLKWEGSHQGQEFPHLYGKLQFHHIETTDMLYKNQRGEWVWEE